MHQQRYQVLWCGLLWKICLLHLHPVGVLCIPSFCYCFNRCLHIAQPQTHTGTLCIWKCAYIKIHMYSRHEYLCTLVYSLREQMRESIPYITHWCTLFLLRFILSLINYVDALHITLYSVTRNINKSISQEN